MKSPCCLVNEEASVQPLPSLHLFFTVESDGPTLDTWTHCVFDYGHASALALICCRRCTLARTPDFSCFLPCSLYSEHKPSSCTWTGPITRFLIPAITAAVWCLVEATVCLMPGLLGLELFQQTVGTYCRSFFYIFHTSWTNRLFSTNLNQFVLRHWDNHDPGVFSLKIHLKIIINAKNISHYF